MTSKDKPPATNANLKSLVKKEFDQLSEAVITRHEISDEDLTKLKQLSELDAYLPKPPAHPARRWPVILLSLGIFLIPGVMISMKVPSVEVQFNLLVTEVSWQQDQPGEIMGYVELDSLGVSSFSSIHLPRTRATAAEELSVPPANFWLPADGSGNISLAPVSAAKGARIWLSKSPGEATAELSIKAPDSDVTVNLSGTVGIDSSGQRLGERDFGRPRPVVIRTSEPRLLDLALHFNLDQNIPFPSNIMISSLSLQQLEDVVVDGLRTPRKISTVLDGEIYNQSMNGKKYKLRKGEWLLVDGVEGEIRSMQITNEGIRLDYHGIVTGISIGSSKNKRDLMPNWLEWFGERNSVKMLWGAFLWLLSTLFGVIKWWRRPQ
jgi:hypothetical protein